MKGKRLNLEGIIVIIVHEVSSETRESRITHFKMYSEKLSVISTYPPLLAYQPTRCSPLAPS